MLSLPILQFFIGQRSFTTDKDIEINETQDVEKKEEALKSILKYLSQTERKKVLAQIKAMKKNKKNFKKSPGQQNSYNRTRSSNQPWIRDDSSNQFYGLPNYHVKVVSYDFKMKYAQSMQEVIRILRQATSRFIRTKEGPRPIITSIIPGTIIHRLGFRPGDLIMRVNGHPVNSVRSAQTLFKALRNDNEYLVEVYRQGKLHRFIFKIGQ
ncbi:MAG: PDZ domain-containing protein [Planctomycetota bacterium]|nr:MAG: PDZ domain-containing protein [Planctomycetota bacterium]